jgi:hypothetical protein
MVILGSTFSIDKALFGEPGRIVSTPIEHQGVRNALRGAFRDKPDMALPDDMRQLLAKMR